jgi:hypothetical protein
MRIEGSEAVHCVHERFDKGDEGHERRCCV